MATSLPDRNLDVESLNSADLETMDEENGVAIGSVVVCRVGVLPHWFQKSLTQKLFMFPSEFACTPGSGIW